MDTIKIAICDDEILLLPHLSAMIRQQFSLHSLTTEVFTFFSSTELLHHVYEKGSFDVYFLDIDIPELNGISLAEKIKEKYADALILYVSAKEDMVFQTFKTQPLAFVRKNCFSKDIQEAIDVMIKHLQKPEDTILSLTDMLGHPLNINVNRTIYIEAKENYQYVVSIDRCEMIRCSIAELDKLLTPFRYMRVHRSYLVNYKYIRRINNDHILLDDGRTIPMSRLRKKEIRQQFMEYDLSKEV